jgi:hypothetical protein
MCILMCHITYVHTYVLYHLCIICFLLCVWDVGTPWIEEQTVEFKFVDVITLIVELLQDNSIASAEHFQWEPTEYTGEYSELASGAWWRDVAHRMQSKKLGCHVCPVSFYTDESHPDWRGGSGFKPLVVSCGNYVGSVTRSMKGNVTYLCNSYLYVTYLCVKYLCVTYLCLCMD